MSQPSQRRKAPYSKDSIRRAFTHHEVAGTVVRVVSPPSPGRPKWRVVFANSVELELTDKEAYAVCVTLAAAETAARPAEPVDNGCWSDDELARRVDP